MHNAWTTCSIDDLKADCKGSIAIGPFGSRMKSDCYVEKGIPVIRGTNITGGPNFEGEFVYISEEKADTLGSSNVYQDDLVFPHRGSIGEVGILLHKKRYVLSSSLMKLTCDQEKAHPMFIYYFFKSPKGKHELLKNASQVGTPGIGQPLTSLKSIELKLPPLPEQKAIAHILGSLDDKIELNRKMNATLEAMAQALFKSWFVDFDPVIDNALAAGNPIPPVLQAKAELRRLNAEIHNSSLRTHHSLFPAAFQQTDSMGWIPDGWEVKQLGKIAQNIRSGVDPTILPSETPYVGLEHIDRHSFSLSRWGVATDVDSQKSHFEPKDFLFGKLRPYFHKVCQVNSEGICSTDILVIRPRHEDDAGYVGCQIFEPEFVEYANLRSTGTRMPRASWKDMAKYEVACAPHEIRKSFNVLVEPIREKCAESIAANQTLTKLRETLLPKLISGDLRIPETEQLAEEALA